MHTCAWLLMIPKGTHWSQNTNSMEIISADNMYFWKIKVTGLPGVLESQPVAGVPSDKMHWLAVTQWLVTRHPG